jgi:hypothetical protein
MPRFTDMAYYDGKDLPRCKAKPSASHLQSIRKGSSPEHLLAKSLVCTLPEGHEDFENPNHREHAWAPDEV